MASSSVVQAKVASLGMSMVHPASGLAALERILATSTVSATAGQHTVEGVPVVDVVPFRWGRLLQRHKQVPSLFSAMANEWQGKKIPQLAGAAGLCGGVTTHGPAVAPGPSAAAAADAAAVRQQLLMTIKTTIADVLGKEVGSHAACCLSSGCSTPSMPNLGIMLHEVTPTTWLCPKHPCSWNMLTAAVGIVCSILLCR